MNVITIRASSLPELFDCPARWEAKYIRKLRLPSSGVAQLGTAVHAGTAAYDIAVLQGNPIKPDEAAGVLVDAIHRPECDIVWNDFTPQTAEKVGISLLKRYCREIAPTQHYLGVEVKCERLEISDLGIALTGSTDRVREEDFALGITDIKTGATAVKADGTVNKGAHIGQLGVYELLTAHALHRPVTAPAQVIGMQTGKTAHAQRVATAPVENASAALIGSDDSPGYLVMASRLIRSGLFYGNPRSQLCSAKYCPAYGICRFRG